jgi:hypothetical protein
MGKYINPIGSSKEEFLDNVINQNLCEQISKERFESLDFDKVNADNKVVLVLIGNGYFSALGVAYCKYELEYWQKDSLAGTDERPMLFYICDKETAEKEIRGY